jgi:hypothetical protein
MCTELTERLSTLFFSAGVEGTLILGGPLTQRRDLLKQRFKLNLLFEL